MKIVCISDTHEAHRKVVVPDGDVLIHAGDCTMMGDHYWLNDFNDWLGELPHSEKVIIWGNHELSCDPHHQGFVGGRAELVTRATVLNDSGCEVGGLRFWGSPVQPEFCNWAFNRKRGEEIKQHWDLIPDGTDVLITHGPPFGVLDSIRPGHPSIGCHELSKAIDRVRPKLVVFGHIHGGYGISERDGITYVNAAVMDERYRPVNEVIVVEVDAAKSQGA